MLPKLRPLSVWSSTLPLHSPMQVVVGTGVDRGEVGPLAGVLPAVITTYR